MQPKFTNERGESLLMQCRHCIRYSLGYLCEAWRQETILERASLPAVG